MSGDDRRLVTVCGDCLRASCWQARFVGVRPGCTFFINGEDTKVTDQPRVQP